MQFLLTLTLTLTLIGGKYSFSMGDLTVCRDILAGYLEASGDGVPWTDLRYLFAEVICLI